MTTTQICNYRVSEQGSFHSHACGKKAVGEKDGRPYCTIHDPGRYMRQAAKKCYYRPAYGTLCGLPAVEVDDSGFGRCAAHSRGHITADERLRRAAPALLEALRVVASRLAMYIESSAWDSEDEKALAQGEAAITLATPEGRTK